MKSHTPLCAAAVFAVSLVAAAGAQDAPACSLITSGEAGEALGKPARVIPGGPERDGYSDCGWSKPGGGVVSLILWSPEAFKEGKPSAAERYASRAGGLSRRNGLVSEPEGLGERARLLDESAAGLPAYTIVMLQGGAVAELSARGVTRRQAIDLMTAAAGRMAFEPAVPDADEPPAQPTDPASPAPPSPEPPEREPAPPEEVSQAKPEPAPERPAPRAKTGSPACPLVSAGDLAALADDPFTASDGGPARGGESRCSWSTRKADVFVSVTLLEAEAIPAESGGADAYFADLEKALTAAGAQLVVDVGDRAVLQTSGEGATATRALSLLKAGRIVFLNVSGAGQRETLNLGHAIAERLPLR